MDWIIAFGVGLVVSIIMWRVFWPQRRVSAFVGLALMVVLIVGSALQLLNPSPDQRPWLNLFTLIAASIGLVSWMRRLGKLT